MTPIVLSTAAELSQQQPARSSSAPGILEIVLLLLVCAAVIAAAYYTTRYMARKAGAGIKSRHMQVLDRLSISKDSQIIIIKAGGKTHMVGITGHSINHLAELDEDFEVIQQEPAQRDTSQIMGDFASRVKAYMPFGSNEAKTEKTAPRRAEKRQAKQGEDQGAEQMESAEKPIRSGLDTLDDMVSRRKLRFETTLEAEMNREQAEPSAADTYEAPSDEQNSQDDRQTAQDGEAL